MALGHDSFVFGTRVLSTDLFSAARPDGAGGGGGKGGGGGGSGGGGAGGDPLLDSYVSNADNPGAFNIEVVFSGTWTAALQDAFVAAADYLSSIILGDVTDVRYRGDSIDDIRIEATLTDIDGAGGILGQAGPTLVRTGTYLPAGAIMEFDIADAEAYDSIGLFDDIVLHEMTHSLGFGTLWGYMGLTTGSVESGDMRFTGAMATGFYASEFSGIAAFDPGAALGVPVETDGAAGTAGGHWDEETFDNELMTGYIDSQNYLSMMSIAALEDMGYDTALDNPASGNDQFASFDPWGIA